MRVSRNFCQGWGSRPDCQKTVLTLLFFFVVVFLVLDLFYSFYIGCQMVISKKTIIFQSFSGGPTFARGGGGVQMLISIETHITCDFPGVRTPYSPFGSALATRNTQS